MSRLELVRDQRRVPSHALEVGLEVAALVGLETPDPVVHASVVQVRDVPGGRGRRVRHRLRHRHLVLHGCHQRPRGDLGVEGRAMEADVGRTEGERAQGQRGRRPACVRPGRCALVIVGLTSIGRPHRRGDTSQRERGAPGPPVRTTDAASLRRALGNGQVQRLVAAAHEDQGRLAPGLPEGGTKVRRGAHGRCRSLPRGRRRRGRPHRRPDRTDRPAVTSTPESPGRTDRPRAPSVPRGRVARRLVVAGRARQLGELHGQLLLLAVTQDVERHRACRAGGATPRCAARCCP